MQCNALQNRIKRVTAELRQLDHGEMIWFPKKKIN